MTCGLPGTSKVAPSPKAATSCSLEGAKPAMQGAEPHEAEEGPELDRAVALRWVRTLPRAIAAWKRFPGSRPSGRARH